jgi:hypothetical protein
MNYIVIDFEGYKLPKRQFIVKEFAYINTATNESMCYFFKSPSIHKLKESELKVVNWLTKHIHKINRYFGTIDFKQFQDIINYLADKDDTIFLIKGQEKSDFISNFTQRQVINIESLCCPPFQFLPYPKQICGHTQHNSNQHCALKKAKAFAVWFENERTCEEKFQSLDISGQMQE